MRLIRADLPQHRLLLLLAPALLGWYERDGCGFLSWSCRCAVGLARGRVLGATSRSGPLLRRLTSDPGLSFQPSLSPDGKLGRL